MLFCPDCENILTTERIQERLSLICMTCDYRYNIEKPFFKKTNYKTKVIDDVYDENESFKNAATCEKKCNKCDSNSAYFIEMQTRSADEPMTIFYTCVKCKETWKE
ncbi:transcription elongation factor TFIIS [Hamiltosporidium tvaerminnensis]|uniref:DNA-directed RNA polymerase subunit n=1 Tax=Hamiltosporidium tvaerminnensis TaxID=1176355 RepID=A0A4Q9KXT7_9MICR|nr:DNA-directed RNA polymerase III subunit RPC10 [Hamiltosporidium tvaerminnensis]TBT99776.1 putative transcription factor S-II [Hamiltosporidium tvaerminnensis]TBU06132.1 transcription elongation factor TFIIS [Hamiltosporidium tvaerminnensis]